MLKPIKVINKIILYCFYSLFLITPLIMTSITSELFEFNKMIFIYLITVIILFFWLTKMILLKKIIIKKTPFDIPILLFFLSQLLAMIFSIDRHTSIFGYYGRFNGGLLSIIAYIILFYSLVSNYWQLGEEIIFKFIKISIISSLLVILWGLPGKWGYDLTCLVFTGQLFNNCWTDQFRPAERLFSTLGQPNWLGAFLAINFFFGIYFFLTKKEKKSLILNTGYLLLNFITILFTRSRSALLSVVSGIILLVIYFIFFFHHRQTLTYYFKKLAVLVICLLSAVFIFKTGINQVDKLFSLDSYIFIFKTNNKSKIPHAVKQNKTTESKQFVTESGEIRRIVWKGAIELGKKYPLFGTGVETFAYAYYFVRPKEHNLTSEWDYLYNKAHNEYLNYLATTGFIGLGSYLLMIAAVIFIGVKKVFYGDKTDKILVVCLLLSYLIILITNFFGFSTTTINLFFYLLPALLIVKKEAPLSFSDKQLNNNLNNPSSTQKIFIFISSLFAVYLLFYIFRYWLADIYYAKGSNYYNIGRYQEAAGYLNKAIKLKYEHVYEDKLSYLLANLALINAYQKQEEATRQMIKLAQYYNQKSLRAAPKNVLYWKTQAKNSYIFYQITNDPAALQMGIQSLKTARYLSPTDPKIPNSLAIFYSLLADETKDKRLKKEYQNLSIKEINLAINLKANEKSYYLLKGQLLKKFSRREEAKKSFQYILDRFDANDAEVISELKNL